MGPGSSPSSSSPLGSSHPAPFRGPGAARPAPAPGGEDAPARVEKTFPADSVGGGGGRKSGQRPLLRAPCRLSAPRSDQVCASPFPTKGESRPESDARPQEGGGPGPRLRARRGAGHGVRSGARTRTRERGERAARAQGASGGRLRVKTTAWPGF